jgi:acetyl esterase/lipase
MSKILCRFLNSYFENEEDKHSLRGSPIKNNTASFAKLPPALVIVAELDPLRDNAICKSIMFQ